MGDYSFKGVYMKKMKRVTRENIIAPYSLHDMNVIEIEDDGSSATVRTGAFDDFRTSHDVHMETDSGDIEGRLRQLQSLYQQELITREEYENKRQEILGRL